jgi:hypothetical protein
MTTTQRLAVLVLASLPLAAPALAQYPVMLPEFQVNTSTPGFNRGSDVALDVDGGFIVTWSEFVEAVDFLGRGYDAEGLPLGEPAPIGANRSNNTVLSSIARVAPGEFVVVWVGYSYGRVLGRRVGLDGTPLGDEFPINTSTWVVPYNPPDVSADPAGNFVVTWSSVPTYSSDATIRARRFDSHGAPLGDEFQVQAGTWGGGLPAVGMSGEGFAVAWRGPGEHCGSGTCLYGRLFDSSGAPLTGDFHISDPLGFYGYPEPRVAMNSAGEFIVVWDDYSNATGTRHALGRRFDSAAVPLGPPFPISDTSDVAFDTRIASDFAGNFVVTWSASPLETLDGEGSRVAARFFDAQGNPVSDEFQVNEIETSDQRRANPSLAEDGSFVITWTSGPENVSDIKARRSGIRSQTGIGVDTVPAIASGPAASDGNGVLEPGESAVVETAWINESGGDVALTGTASAFSGPAGATYTLDDATANYGTIPAGQPGGCTATGDCHAVTVSSPAARPVPHWDAQLQETLSIGVPHTWPIHIGESFPDVPTGNIFYAFIETLFHNGITGGCFGGGYCPTNPVTRAQMAVFLLKSKFGAAHIPPPCTGTVFTDVPCTGGPFDPWIEELAGLAITGGCGGGLYCPGNTVTRQQMAVFLLKALEGSAYDPPDCADIFDDVPCTPGNGFSDWIEELYDRGITGGCSVTPPLYCPTNPNNRGQMAVFLVKTFGLVLYGG